MRGDAVLREQAAVVEGGDVGGRRPTEKGVLEEELEEPFRFQEFKTEMMFNIGLTKVHKFYK